MENCIKFDNMGMINEGLQFDFIENLLRNILFLYHRFFDPLDGKNHPSFFMQSQLHRTKFSFAEILEVLEICYFQLRKTGELVGIQR